MLRKIQGFLKRSYHHERCVYAECIQEDTELRQLFHEYEGGMILTPHLKEMSRLTGEEIAEIRSNLPKAAASTADKGHVIVLKDAEPLCPMEAYLHTLI